MCQNAIVVSDLGNKRIQIFTREGEFVNQLICGPENDVQGMRRPIVDPEGNFILVPSILRISHWSIDSP